MVVALPGVQRFIAEARSTSDVAGASGIFVALARRIATVLRDGGGQLVFPSGSLTGDGMPNRVVALFPADQADGGAGQVSPVEVARRAVDELWQEWARRALKLPRGAVAPDPAGFPLVQWVSVPPLAGGYPEQWREAQRFLAARRRVNDFTRKEWSRRALCSLSPRYPALDKPPPGLPAHEDASLSVSGWVKRRWRHIHDREGSSSTASVASAPFRGEVVARLGDDRLSGAVADLRAALDRVNAACPGLGRAESPVPGLSGAGSDLGDWLVSAGGPWVFQDRWQAESLAREGEVAAADLAGAVADGRAAARRLVERAKSLGIPAPASHLAVIVQDLDSMGRFLSGVGENAAGDRLEVTPERHQAVSATLQHLARAQLDALQSPGLLGVPVYAGGDDLLAFAPAATALRAARACHDAAPDSLGLPTASTAVLYFHYHAGMQSAITTAHECLDEAKRAFAKKHALAVGYLRRSGGSAFSIQPWSSEGGINADRFGIFTAGTGPRLSPRLVADLERDAAELARLSAVSERLYRAELARLVRRHTEKDSEGSSARAADVAAALEILGRHEATGALGQRAPGARPQPAARVGVFLRQEAR